MKILMIIALMSVSCLSLAERIDLNFKNCTEQDITVKTYNYNDNSYFIPADSKVVAPGNTEYLYCERVHPFGQTKDPKQCWVKLENPEHGTYTGAILVDPGNYILSLKRGIYPFKKSPKLTCPP